MAIIAKLIVLVASVGQALACVHATGYIDTDPFELPTGGHFAQLWDNGDLKCEGSIGHLDQDNHYGIDCKPGYVWAFTQDLKHSWYGYGSAAFQWDQAVQTGSFDCGACNGRTGHCQQCKVRQFDVYMFC